MQLNTQMHSLSGAYFIMWLLYEHQVRVFMCVVDARVLAEDRFEIQPD